jgi:hypothetical protein
MKKHAPGTWERMPGENASYIDIAARQEGLVAPTQKLTEIAYSPVCRVKKHFYAEANARLIAAAPDLLAACHLALRFWYSDQPNDTPESIAAKHAIRDAINKAEGE